jgi:Reverse transcriptase (RNA-dependent DNA polymerase)
MVRSNSGDSYNGSPSPSRLKLTPEQKWPSGTLEIPATTEDINEFMQWRIDEYRKCGHNGSDLSAIYGEEFNNFTEETFRQAQPMRRTDLRNILRGRGVYVPSGRNTDICKALVGTAQDEIPWPIDDPLNPSNRTKSRNQSQIQSRTTSPVILQPQARSRFISPILPPLPQTLAQARSRFISPILPSLPQTLAPRTLTPTQLQPEQRPQQPTPTTGQPQRIRPVQHTVGFESLHQDTPIQPRQPNPFQGNRRDTIPSRREATSSRRQTLLYEPDPQLQTDFSRQIANLEKIYKDEDRYSGQSDDSFDFKLDIFVTNCRRAGIPAEAYELAFPTMLTDLARDYYFKSCRDYRDVEQICEAIRKRFETKEQRRSNILDWEALKLDNVIKEHPDKSTKQCLDILIRQMTVIQRNLPPSYHTDDILCDKLLNACRANKACRNACYKASDTLLGIINDLQSSIKTYEQSRQEAGIYTADNHDLDPVYDDGDDDPHIHFTDRRYRGPSRNPPKFRPRRQFRSPPPPPRQARDQAKKCIVCFKYGCWSTNHSPAERQEAAKKMKQRYQRYMTELEPGDPDDLDDFDTLIMDDIDDTDHPTPDPTTFFISCGEIDPEQGHQIVDILATQITEYSLTQSDITEPTAYFTDRYSSARFVGVMIDTGAAQISTAGKGQYQAYIKTFGPIPLDTSNPVSVRFGIGNTQSIGTITLTLPMGTAKFHVVDTDTPFLLCLQDMDQMQMYYNNVTNQLVYPGGSYPVTRRFDHPFIMWTVPTTIAYLTEPELRQLHRRFGHPAVERLIAVLNRAGHSDPKHQELLRKITQFCTLCQRHGQSPRRFKFTLRSDNVEFNHTIYVDVMYINNSPILHVVDEATRFQATRWLDNMSAQHTWDMLRACWIDTYLGPPDLIVHDAGTNFTAQEFKQNAHILHIRTKAVPTEAAQSMGIVERYHAPLRRAYEVISDELQLPSNMVNKSLMLQMATKAVNDTAGPDGLVPTLLVFGTYPRLSESDPPTPIITQRAIAIRRATQEVTKLRARRQVTDALRQRNGPKVDRIHDLAIGSDVLVWRIHEKAWTGPHKLSSIDNETATVEVNGRPTPFRTTAVKPYLQPDEATADATVDPADEATNDPTDEAMDDGPTDEPAPMIDDITDDPTIVVQPESITPEQPRRGRGRPRKHPEVVSINLTNQARPDITLQKPPFQESRQKEINGLFDHGVFEVVDVSDLPADSQVFRSRFVDEIKFAGTDKAYEKSRFVVQGYNDEGKSQILTQAPTIQRASQRLLLSLAPSFRQKGMRIYLRDISQAYTQSTTPLARNVFIKPPADLGYPESKLLRVVQPLYGLAEAGTHWFNTYHRHHCEKLNMASSTFDPCLLVEASNPTKGVIGMQTDDTLILATDELADTEQTALCFPSKPRQELTTTEPIHFNGALIELERNGSITITQSRQISKIEPVQSPEGYIAQRARGAYIATVSQPERAFGYSFAAQVSGLPTAEQIEFLNKQLSWQLEHANRGLRFVPLDLPTLRVAVFTDSSFANNPDMSSQIGYIVVIVDKNDAANIVHWGSVKCRRVTRSVLAAELYAMSLGFDNAVVIKSTIQRILNRLVDLTIYIDSKSLYDCLVRLGSTNEKRLMIDVMCLRQSYERREISQVVWINRKYNIADAMTKDKPNSVFTALIDSNRLDVKEGTIGWVERKED